MIFLRSGSGSFYDAISFTLNSPFNTIKPDATIFAVVVPSKVQIAATGKLRRFSPYKTKIKNKHIKKMFF